MIKAAKNYEDVIRHKMRDTWFDLDYQFYYSDSYHSDIRFDDETAFEFVSINAKNNEVIGFVSFRINRDINGVRQFGAISFDRGNLIFTMDLMQIIDDIFFKYNFNRLEWCCVDGNPALESYKRLCESHGGEIVAHEHDCVRTIDGQLRDCYTFEILKKNYVNPYKRTYKDGNKNG